MADPVTTEPQGPSLDAAKERIDSLLSVKEEKPAKTAPPEPAPESAAEPKLVPAESEGDAPEIEPATSEGEEGEPEPPSQPRTFKVKVNGQEIEVTEDEVLKGYSRTEDYTRKTQQLAEQRKQFEEREVAAVRAERQQYATYLEQLSTALKSLTPEEPNWDVLRTQVTPDVFAAELLNWQQTQKRIEKVEAERATVKEQQDRDAQEGFKQYVQAEQAKLEEALPDIKDPDKARVLKTKLGEFAESRGFSKEELGRVTDHRLVLLLHDAMAREAERKAEKAKAPEIKNKIEKAMATAEPGARTTAPKANALKEATARLKKSGSVDDGAAAIRHLLG
jgi:hypothetical protein